MLSVASSACTTRTPAFFGGVEQRVLHEPRLDDVAEIGLADFGGIEHERAGAVGATLSCHTRMRS